MTPVLFAEVTIDASEHRDAHWFDLLCMGLLTPKTSTARQRRTTDLDFLKVLGKRNKNILPNGAFSL